MTDPILEEIWRVREKLIQEHGGVDTISNTSSNWMRRDDARTDQPVP